MFKLWGRKSSINVQKVMWVAEELGVPYEQIEVGGRFGGLETPEFIKLNPNRRVPVIEDDGHTIWETNTIIRYLCAKHGTGSWWPQDPAERAAQDKWMDWTLADLQPAFVGLFARLWRTPEMRRDWTLIRKAVVRTNMLFRILNKQLEGHRFVGGETIAMGDVPAGGILYRYYCLEIRRPPLPNVEAWYARLREREAYRKRIMVSFEELKGKPAVQPSQG
jgi:glutathione S-transferase